MVKTTQAHSMLPEAPRSGVYFINIEDGSTLFSGFELAFGLAGKFVSPAGTASGDQSKGHHHLLIDAAPIEAGKPVPADATHIHFGKGQLGYLLTLAPGAHTLTLQFADSTHQSYGPKWSKSVKVEVLKAPDRIGPYFIGLQDDASIESPIRLEFGLFGYAVSPAGTTPLDKTKGHHHLIIDRGSIAAGVPIPSDDNHIHFGKGQTRAEVQLTQGHHSLTLQLADALHRSYGERLSKTIHITVRSIR
jgi:hypothetical protein